MSFRESEGVWAERLGSLRNTVRQHVIATQLDGHLDGVADVLDVGCGQGTQALRLATHGLTVTGVDLSENLLSQMRAGARAQGLNVEAICGDVAHLNEAVGGRRFDLVCAHGLLMYLDDAYEALDTLTRQTRPEGRVSFTVRNGDALAYRPGVRGDYSAALAAFGTTDYRNELGVNAQAHTRAQVMRWCEHLGLVIEAWYGVRVFTDGMSSDVQPSDVDITTCLAAEEQAGRRDPYRSFGSMLHFVASRQG